MMNTRVRAARSVAGFLLATVLAGALTVGAHGQASESQPAARPLEVPAVTLSIEDVAEVHVEPGVPPEAELAKPELAVPLPEADELGVVTPGLPEVLTDSGDIGTGLLGPGLALQAAVATGNNGLLTSGIALQHAGDGPDFHLGVDHLLLEGFGPAAPLQGYHRTDDLQGAYSSDIGGAELGVAGRYRRVEDGLQDTGDPAHVLSHQLVDGNLLLLVRPSDFVTVSGEIGGRGASREFRGSDELSVTEWQGRAGAGMTAQLRQLEIGVTGDYEFRHIRVDQPTAHRLLGQLALAYDLGVPIRLGARAGVQYASEDDSSEVRIPFEVSVDGMPSDLITLRIAAGREIIGRDLASVYETLKFVEEPSELRDTRQWFGDLSVRAAVGEDVHLVASVRGESGANRVDITGDLGASGLHQLAQSDEAGTLQTGLGLRWDINPNAALNLDWSGAFFDIPLYQAPHVFSLGMRATWDGGRFGVENNVDWVFPNELETGTYRAPDVGLPIVSARGFYNVSDNFAIVAGLADLLQPLSDEPRYELAPYEEPGFQASLGVEVNL